MSAGCNERRTIIAELVVYAQEIKEASQRIQRPNDKDLVIMSLCDCVVMIDQYHEAGRIEFVSSFHSTHESYLRLNAL